MDQNIKAGTGKPGPWGGSREFADRLTISEMRAIFGRNIRSVRLGPRLPPFESLNGNGMGRTLGH